MQKELLRHGAISKSQQDRWICDSVFINLHDLPFQIHTKNEDRIKSIYENIPLDNIGDGLKEPVSILIREDQAILDGLGGLVGDGINIISRSFYVADFNRSRVHLYCHPDFSKGLGVFLQDYVVDVFLKQNYLVTQGVWLKNSADRSVLLVSEGSFSNNYYLNDLHLLKKIQMGYFAWRIQNNEISIKNISINYPHKFNGNNQPVDKVYLLRTERTGATAERQLSMKDLKEVLLDPFESHPVSINNSFNQNGSENLCKDKFKILNCPLAKENDFCEISTRYLF